MTCLKYQLHICVNPAVKALLKTRQPTSAPRLYPSSWLPRSSEEQLCVPRCATLLAAESCGDALGESGCGSEPELAFAFCGATARWARSRRADVLAYAPFVQAHVLVYAARYAQQLGKFSACFVTNLELELKRMINYIDAKLTAFEAQGARRCWRLAPRSIAERVLNYPKHLQQLLQVARGAASTAEPFAARAATRTIPRAADFLELAALSVLFAMPRQQLIPNKFKKKVQEEVSVLTLAVLADLQDYAQSANLLALFCCLPKLAKVAPIPVLQYLSFSASKLLPDQQGVPRALLAEFQMALAQKLESLSRK